MSAPTLPIRCPAIPAHWRPRLMLLFIIACFVAPLAAAVLLVGRWQPGGSVQHGELLHPARPLPAWRIEPAAGHSLDGAALRGRWVLAYAGPDGECDPGCRAALYAMRQVRLALGKDMERVKTAWLLANPPDSGLRRWLAMEHAVLTAGAADAATRTALLEAFERPGGAGDWIYLIDPLGNLLMRYPVTVEPRGMLKDLQRLLKWSRIG